MSIFINAAYPFPLLSFPPYSPSHPACMQGTTIDSRRSLYFCAFYEEGKTNWFPEGIRGKQLIEKWQTLLPGMPWFLFRLKRDNRCFSIVTLVPHQLAYVGNNAVYIPLYLCLTFPSNSRGREPALDIYPARTIWSPMPVENQFAFISCFMMRYGPWCCQPPHPTI